MWGTMVWPLHVLEAADKPMLCSTTQGGDPGPNYISPGAVALSSAVVVINCLLSLWLKLDMHWQLLIGAVRRAPPFRMMACYSPCMMLLFSCCDAAEILPFFHATPSSACS